MKKINRKEPYVTHGSRELTSLAARIMIEKRKETSTEDMSLLLSRIQPNSRSNTCPLEKSLIMKS